MITHIIEDTRNKIDKNTHIREYFDKQGIQLIRTKMLVGDFTLPTKQDVCIDLKKDIQELIGDLTSQHERFKRELQLSKQCNIKLIILIQDEKVSCINDLYTWYNWRLKKSPKATKGSTLAKMLYTIENNTEDYNCQFLFVKKTECGAKIIELLEEEKMKIYKIYRQTPTWKLLDIKCNIEDMYKYVCDCYENNPINYLVIEKNIELDSEFPLVSIINEEKYLEFKEQYKPYAKVKKI